MSMSIGPRTTAILMVTCAVLGAVGLTGLRRVLGYPDVLITPAAETLSLVRERWLPICAFVSLAATASALLIPATLGVLRMLPASPDRRVLGVLTPLMVGSQLTGLLFWPLAVPALARQAAIPAGADRAAAVFDTARTLIGVLIGEATGCLATAAWTVVLLQALGRPLLEGRCALRAGSPRLTAVGLAAGGVASAAGTLGGVLLAFGVGFAAAAAVTGQLLWYLWLVGLAVAVWRFDPAWLVPPSDGAPSSADRARDAGENLSVPIGGGWGPSGHCSGAVVEFGDADTDIVLPEIDDAVSDIDDAVTEIGHPGTGFGVATTERNDCTPEVHDEATEADVMVIGDDTPTDPGLPS